MAGTGVIDAILEADRQVPRKQRHTAKRIFERLRDEHGFDGGYTTVKDYVRENRRRTQEMFVPLSHAPGHAQCDFGEARVIIGGVERKVLSRVNHICRFGVNQFCRFTSSAWPRCWAASVR